MGDARHRDCLSSPPGEPWRRGAAGRGAHGRRRSRDCRLSRGCAGGRQAGWPAGRPPPAFRQSNETDRRVRARPAARGRSMRTGGIARHRARIIRTATGGIGLACPVDHHIAANQQHECQDAQDRRGRCARLLERRVAKRARDARRPRVKGARRMRGIRCAGIESNGQFRRPQTGQCSSARKATKPHSLQRKLAVRRVSARAVRIARQSSRERMVRLGGLASLEAGGRRQRGERSPVVMIRSSTAADRPVPECRERTSSTVVRMRCSWDSP